jgi:thiol-disulfide isomerase/thioredoxin
MRHFWKGFNSPKNSAPVSFKKHVIVLYWSPEDKHGEASKDRFKKVSFKYPHVSVKVINIKKDPLKPLRHKILASPTVLLLKDGREVDRMNFESETLLEHLFRKANT